MKVILVFFISILLFTPITVTPISINNKPFINNEKYDDVVLDNLVVHQWPMFKHDSRHTGLSEYDTSDNPGVEKWKYFVDSSLTSTAVIDKNGILYIAANMMELHSVYPNGTRNWKQELIGFDGYHPAIGHDGTIYVGTIERFHAFYPNGTIRWILDKDKTFIGYPVVGPDDIIYVGTRDGYLYAIYPNGTIKWEYKVEDVIRAPALDHEGNIYFTTYYDYYLYCLNPNGTFKWKFKSIDVFYNGPVIGEDGTIYLSPSTIYVQAVNPNGTEKWRTKLYNAGAAIPAIAPDGTLIISGKSEYVNALNPNNGSILWTYYVGTNVEEQTSAVIGSDGTIFFVYNEFQDVRKGYICALTPEGSLKWKTRLTTDVYPYSGMNILSDLSIGSDGTVYVTTWFIRGGSNYTNIGYLHAIGELDPNAPNAPLISGETKGKVEEIYEYTFSATSPVGNDLYYFIDWDDRSVENWIGPYPSGVEIKVNHTWAKKGIYNIAARAKVSDNIYGPWRTLEVTMPKSKAVNFNTLLLKLLEQFPILKEVLLRLIIR